MSPKERQVHGWINLNISEGNWVLGEEKQIQTKKADNVKWIFLQWSNNMGRVSKRSQLLQKAGVNKTSAIDFPRRIHVQNTH